jgi:superfamily II DNA/RNA helicase
MDAMKAKGGRQGRGPTGLVLSPTRELASQTSRVLKLLLPGLGIKGSLLAKSTAAGSDFCKVDVLIATPLMLVESLQASKVRSQFVSIGDAKGF